MKVAAGRLREDQHQEDPDRSRHSAAGKVSSAGKPEVKVHHGLLREDHQTGRPGQKPAFGSREGFVRRESGGEGPARSGPRRPAQEDPDRSRLSAAREGFARREAEVKVLHGRLREEPSREARAEALLGVRRRRRRFESAGGWKPAGPRPNKSKFTGGKSPGPRSGPGRGPRGAGSRGTAALKFPASNACIGRGEQVKDDQERESACSCRDPRSCSGRLFRASTRDEAVRIGVGGWVRNLPDGSVEALFEGEKKKVEEIVAWCYKGPSGARVRKVELKWEPYKGEFKHFDVRYGW